MEHVFKQQITQCRPRKKPGLFREFPDHVKSNEAIVKGCIEKCTEKHIADLFDALPENVKSDQDTVDQGFEKSSGFSIKKIFAAPLEDQSLEKCDPKSIAALVCKFHKHAQSNNDAIVECIEKSDSAKLPDLLVDLPENMNNSQKIRSYSLWTCGSTQIKDIFDALPEAEQPEDSRRGLAQY